MRFEFATATRILFGQGAIKEDAPLAVSFGRRVLIVAGSTSDHVARLVEQLKSRDVEVSTFGVSGEPSIETVQAGIKLAHEHNCAAIIGLGGGSAIDTGKAIAALST